MLKPFSREERYIPITTTQPPRKILDLLLVEDNPGDIVLFRECFKRLKVPHRLHAALDGEEALLFLEHGEKFRDSPRPDLILMDLTLPRMDGLELLQKVKSNAHLRQIPVIVFTGSAAERDISRSYDLHANCYITKPAELKDLAAVVEAIERFWLKRVILPSTIGEDKSIGNTKEIKVK